MNHVIFLDSMSCLMALKSTLLIYQDDLHEIIYRILLVVRIAEKNQQFV